MDTTTTQTTGAVKRRLGIRMRQIEYVLDCHPEIAPPVVDGRRLWSPSHVAALKTALKKVRKRA